MHEGVDLGLDERNCRARLQNQMCGRRSPGTETQRDPAALTVSEDAHRFDPTPAAKSRNRTRSVGSQLVDRSRSPGTARSAYASLVVGKHRHACLCEVLADRLEQPVVVPIRWAGTADEYYAYTRTRHIRQENGAAQLHARALEIDLFDPHPGNLGSTGARRTRRTH